MRCGLIFGLFATTAALAQSPRRGVTDISGAGQPQLAVGSDGRVWLAYGRVSAAATPPAQDGGSHKPPAGHGHGAARSRPEGEIFVACSDDGGATFSPATRVAIVPNLMLGMRRGPRIAAHGNRLTVTVVGSELHAFHSANGGKSWTGPKAINDVPGSAREGLHDLAAGPAGKTFVTWLDLRNGKMELWGAESKDGGATWGANQQVYRSPDKSICECCHPNALYDAEGNLAVMWRNSIEGLRDMWISTRPNGARGFTPAKKLGEGSWTLNACPMDGGEIVALGRGKFGAVWMRAGEVFYSEPGGREANLGKGKQPVALLAGRQPLVVWQQGSDLVSTRIGEKTAPEKRAKDARFAVMVPVTGGGGAVLAYEQGPQKNPHVVVERL